MIPNHDQAEQVGQFYDGYAPTEAVRLEQDCPVEFAVTAHCLRQRIVPGSRVADIGVGGGHYAERLASLGCTVHLVDVSEKLLEAARLRLHAAGLQDRIAGLTRCSATDLANLPDGAFDAVLLLGPLYHICRAEDRQRAVREAARILKPAGTVFAAGINRLTYLRDLFRQAPQEAVQRRVFHQHYLQEGVLDPSINAAFPHAHLTSVPEFRSLLTDRFEEQALLGVESFTGGPSQKSLTGLSAGEQAAWLELVEATAATPEGLGMADHFLFIGRKRAD